MLKSSLPFLAFFTILDIDLFYSLSSLFPNQAHLSFDIVGSFIWSLPLFLPSSHRCHCILSIICLSFHRFGKLPFQSCHYFPNIFSLLSSLLYTPCFFCLSGICGTLISLSIFFFINVQICAL